MMMYKLYARIFKMFRYYTLDTLTQKITLKPKTRYLMTTLTSDRSCLYLVIAFMVSDFAMKTR